MKKTAILATLILFCLAFSACGGKTDPDNENPTSQIGGEYYKSGKFCAGFSRNVCMPDDPVPMEGYGNDKLRFSDGFKDYLTITCTAIQDEKNNLLLLFTEDTINAGWSKNLRQLCAETFGIPMENVNVTATHTHASVSTLNKTPAADKFFEDLTQTGLQTAMEAVADLAPAEMHWGMADLSGYNFVRHYVLSNGEVVGDNFGTDTGEYVGHSTEENPWMSAVQFKREGTKDIYLATWRAHAHITGKTNSLSADFPAPLRDYLEKELDCWFGYYQGDAGNSNPHTRNPKEGVDGLTYKGKIERDYRLYAQKIGDIFIQAVKEKEWEKIGDGTGEIRTHGEVYTGKVNHSEDYLKAEAIPIYQKFVECGVSSQAMELSVSGEIRSAFHASGILTKASLPATKDEYIAVAQVGDLGFTFAPNELFVENGNFVRENSPYKYTMFIGYSNESHSYIPSQAGYDYHCYEMNLGSFAPGTAELLMDHYLELLKDLQNK